MYQSISDTERPRDEFAASDHILALGAHPDDIDMFHGEYIRRARAVGAAITQAVATAGEETTEDHRIWLWRILKRHFIAHGGREQEANKAAKRWGIPPQNVHHLRFPDGFANSDNSSSHYIDALTLSFIGLMRAKRVSKVVTAGAHGYDQHPDHVAVHLAAARAVKFLRLTYNQRITLFSLTAHNASSLQLPVNRHAKLWALIAHCSQFAGYRVFGRFILPKHTKQYLARYSAVLHQEAYVMQ